MACPNAATFLIAGCIFKLSSLFSAAKGRRGYKVRFATVRTAGQMRTGFVPRRFSPGSRAAAL